MAGCGREWGKHAKPDRIGMTFMAINQVSATPEPDRRFRSGGCCIPATSRPIRELRTNWKIKSRPSMALRASWIAATRSGSNTPIELTEEALDRQMRPARQLHWEDMTPLPDEIERAFDQFATYLIQALYLCSDIARSVAWD